MKKQLMLTLLFVSMMLLSLPIRVASLQRGTITIKVTPSAFVTVRGEGFFDSGKTPFQTTLDYGSYTTVVMLAGYSPKSLSFDVNQPVTTIEVELVENPNWKQLIDVPAGALARFDDTYSNNELPIITVEANGTQAYSLTGGNNPTAIKVNMTSDSLAWSTEQLTRYHVAVWQALGVEPQTKIYMSPSERYVLLPRWVANEQNRANLWLVDLENSSEVMIPELLVSNAEQLMHNNVQWASDDSGFITSLSGDSQPRLFHISVSPLEIAVDALLPLVKSAEPSSSSLIYTASNNIMDHILVAILVPGPAIKLATIDVVNHEIKILPNPDWLLMAACWLPSNDILLMHPSYGILRVNYQTLNIEEIVSPEDLGGVTVDDARFSTDCKDLFVLTDAVLSDGDVLGLHLPGF